MIIIRIVILIKLCPIIIYFQILINNINALNSNLKWKIRRYINQFNHNKLEELRVIIIYRYLRIKKIWEELIEIIVWNITIVKKM